MGTRGNKRSSEILRARIRQMLAAGYSIARMAKETGKSVAHVTRIAEQRKGISMTAASLGAIDLLPCPFCGAAVQFRKALFPSDGCTDAIIHAAPTDCGLCDFSTHTTDESVIATWNRRPAAGAAPDSASLNQIVPRAYRYPKPDPNTGADTGPCCAHAYADGWNECRREVLDAIKRGESATPVAAAPPVAEGWVLVPREPTTAMLDACCATDEDDDEMRQAYAEMLRAAPTPPAARPTGEGACRTCKGRGYTDEGDPEIGSAIFDCEACTVSAPAARPGEAAHVDHGPGNAYQERA